VLTHLVHAVDTTLRVGVKPNGDLLTDVQKESSLVDLDTGDAGSGSGVHRDLVDSHDSYGRTCAEGCEAYQRSPLGNLNDECGKHPQTGMILAGSACELGCALNEEKDVGRGCGTLCREVAGPGAAYECCQIGCLINNSKDEKNQGIRVVAAGKIITVKSAYNCVRESAKGCKEEITHHCSNPETMMGKMCEMGIDKCIVKEAKDCLMK